MKRTGFRAGYHPPAPVLNELKIFDKKKRNYIDKQGNVYSNRAVQEARNGYISIEDARQLRKEGWGEILNWKTRKEFPISLPALARRWENANHAMRGTAFKSKKFRNHLQGLLKRVMKPDQPDDEYYEDVSEYLEDHFDMEYQELTWEMS